MPTFSVRLLGSLKVTNEANAVVRFRARSTEVVFAYLALYAGKEIRRETLIAVAWPEADEQAGRQSLRSALTNLRKTFGPTCIEADRMLVRLVPERFDIDVHAVRSGRVLEAYGGRLLEGLDCDWALAHAIELEEAYFSAVIDRMGKVSPGDAVALGSNALSQDPSRLDVLAKLRELTPGSELSETPGTKTSFIGREKELADLEELLRRHRLVTLTGPGGCGKTRIAGELHRRLRPQAWFVSLSSIRDPQAVPDAVRRSLRIPDAPGRTPLEQVAFTLGESAGALVLDNFEQILPAAEFCQSLLAYCPNLRIVVTSQALLAVADEIEFPVGPLAIESESQQLFLERARAVSPNFEFDESAAELCRRLDGYPLAVEIAAAKSRTMSASDMLDQLSDRFGFLNRGDRGHDRHRSLHVALDWSFERLPEEAQDLLSDLTVFRGEFTLKGVDEVIRREGGRSLVETLVSHAWIQPASPGRFRLIESVREYGSELLRPRRLSELQQSHAEFYVRFAKHCEDAIYTPQEPASHDLIDREHGNLDAAWDWLIVHDSEAALKLMTGINWYATLRGHWAVGEKRLEAAMAAASDEPSDLLAHAFHCLATFVFWQGRMRESVPLFEKASEFGRQIGSTICQMHPAMGLAMVYAELGEHADARRNAEVSVELAILTKNDNWLGAAYTGLSLGANRLNHPKEAIATGTQAVDHARRGGYPWGIASALNELAMGYHLAGEYEMSLMHQLEAIEIKRACDARRSLALSLVDASATYLAIEDFKASEACLREGIELLATLQRLESLPRAFSVAETHFARRGNPESATQCREAADGRASYQELNAAVALIRSL